MNVHELRIGNYLYTDEGKINSVYLISKSVIEFSDPHTICDPDLCSPVLLTEEWFMLLGFTTDGVVWEKDGFVIGNYASGYFYVPILYKIANDVGRVIKHVHQLQNLYFAITGEELTIAK